MSEEFTPITTQEDLNRIISDRIQRERAKYADYDALKAAADKYKDYDQVKADLQTANDSLADLQGKYTALENQSKEKDTKIASYAAENMKVNVAIEKKLPLEMRKYLQGSTEEELKSSADELLKFYGNQDGGDPSANLDGTPADSEKALYMELAKSLQE